jgi:hypothetical protein
MTALAVSIALGAFVQPSKAQASGAPTDLILIGLLAMSALTVGGVIALGAAVSEIQAAVEEDEKRVATQETASVRVAALPVPGGAQAAVSFSF